MEQSESSPQPAKILIPKAYETELQSVFHALGDMQQPASATRWESAGTQGIGVLVSDTLMFQRAAPEPSDANLGQFYGMALPLLGLKVRLKGAAAHGAAAADARNARRAGAD